MIKRFTLASFTLVSLLLIVFSLYHTRDTKSLEQLSQVAAFPSVALSNSFLEKRITLYDDTSNRLYPEMHNFQKLDFIYAR